MHILNDCYKDTNHRSMDKRYHIESFRLRNIKHHKNIAFGENHAKHMVKNGVLLWWRCLIPYKTRYAEISYVISKDRRC